MLCHAFAKIIVGGATLYLRGNYDGSSWAALGGMSAQGSVPVAEPPAKEIEHLELSPTHTLPVWLREGWGSIVYLPFLLLREFPPTTTPLVHFLLLVNISYYQLYAVSQWD